MKTKFDKKHYILLEGDLKSFGFGLIISIMIGLIVGTYSSLFGLAINWMNVFRGSHAWLVFLLPLGGICIVALYRFRKVDDKGTNRVFEAITSGDPVPLDMTPLITISTAITQFLGGSAGREGAALQFGGSLGSGIGKLLKLDQNHLTITTLCGMSAAFSAMFGTPLTATIFALEVTTIGIMQYSALLPCAVSSLTAWMLAKLFGLNGFGAELSKVAFPDFTLGTGLGSLLLGILCAIVGIAFCIALHQGEKLASKIFKNQYLKTIVGGILIILLTLVIGSNDYNGLGINVIADAVDGHTVPYAFALKIIFTAITIASFYKGGEIVPTLFIGATFGCFFFPLIGLPASFGTALGICGLFCAVTNSPVSAIVMSIELFGFEGIPFFLIVAAISYRLSGYYGLYTGQRIMYSKRLPKFVNKHTHQ